MIDERERLRDGVVVWEGVREGGGHLRHGRGAAE